MKKFKVSFQQSEYVYCTNIVIAATEKAVVERYAKYPWYNATEATESDIEEAERKGMPIVTIPQKAAKKERTGYYNDNVLAKFRDALKQAREDVLNGTVQHVSISDGNSKMGLVSSVSTLPFLTCPAVCKGTCGKDCYAAKIANMYGSVLTAYARNTALLMYKPETYWKEVEQHMRGVRFFRFHVSGDIRNAEDFRHIIDCCTRNPHCETLVFTKRFGIVNAWIDENGSLPENLHLLFSGWEDMKPENPHQLPETNIYGKKEQPREEWLLCGGNCFECGCRGVGCWQAKKGDVIAFKKH